MTCVKKSGLRMVFFLSCRGRRCNTGLGTDVFKVYSHRARSSHSSREIPRISVREFNAILFVHLCDTVLPKPFRNGLVAAAHVSLTLAFPPCHDLHYLIRLVLCLANSNYLASFRCRRYMRSTCLTEAVPLNSEVPIATAKWIFSSS